MDTRVVKIPARYTISVILSGPPDKIVTVEGRIAKMIVWLLQHRARIERIGTGQFIFNLGLTHFEPEIREHFPRMAAPRENPDESSEGLPA